MSHVEESPRAFYRRAGGDSNRAGVEGDARLNIRGNTRVVGDQDDSPQRAELAQITLHNEGAMLSQLRDDVTSKVWWGRIVKKTVRKSRS